jgi:NADPH:quinone reductase-like Zn-dependent oxidoreductase
MITNRMKALRFAEFGPPSVLHIEEVPIPEPSDGEALVRVKAAAINPSDIGNVAGRFKKTTLPRTPGRDFAGVVVKGSSTKAKRSGAAPRISVSSMMARTPSMSLSQWRRYRLNQNR